MEKIDLTKENFLLLQKVENSILFGEATSLKSSFCIYCKQKYYYTEKENKLASCKCTKCGNDTIVNHSKIYPDNIVIFKSVTDLESKMLELVNLENYEKAVIIRDFIKNYLKNG